MPLVGTCLHSNLGYNRPYVYCTLVGMKNIKDKLERLLDDFREWKSIYGSQVPAGYAEPKDRANERKKFIADIAKLREQYSMF